MERAGQAWAPAGSDAAAGERYLLLADISGYTGFMNDVEQVHGVDFSAGIPGGYSVLGALLDGVIEGTRPDFELIKLEGDAVFAAAPAPMLDSQGDMVLTKLGALYRAFIENRTRAIPTSDHICTACPFVANLDLKMILHRGHAVRQTVGARTDLLGPAVNIAHRLLKNTVRDQIGARPYLLLTDAAAVALGLADIGVAHHEQYPDAGPVEGRIVELSQPARGQAPSSLRDQTALS